MNPQVFGGGWPVAERREERFEFETLISDLSSRFINRTPDEVDSEIEDALRLICELVGIDYAVLWQWSGTPLAVITPTHFYYAQEGFQPHEPLRQELFPWCRQQMLAGRMVVISSLEELPAEAAVDRENGRLLGIKSNLTIPLAVGGEPPVGALSLNTLLAERGWTDALVMRLQLVAQVFTNALARRRHDQNLQESEARLAAGAELAGLAFYEVDFAEKATYVDDRLRQLCGIPPERERGLDALEFWMEHLHPDDRERMLDERRELHDGRMERLSIEYRYLHPAQGEKWIQHLAGVTRRDASGRAVYTYGVLRDVTERKQVENEMRDLSRRLIRAQEDERALLARELHDDVTQRLAVLAIEVGRIELSTLGATQAEAMQAVREGLTRLSEDVHSLAYQLHPSVLEELGLAEALRAECERRLRQGWLDLSANIEPLTTVVGKDAALCLFRLAQEALNNVARHAGTCAASVTLREMDGGLLLAVRDDGIGFDPEHPRARMQLGLVGMRERVLLAHGTLDIESAPSRGTTIVAWVPAAGEAR
ncbi:PAS domain-containing protein [Propionivibrio sp.]|uniref:PAS domain-containing protein n=1 Tax=Propionivibrio sp. TaxID=2212460 RepID=UPI003BF29D97